MRDLALLSSLLLALLGGPGAGDPIRVFLAGDSTMAEKLETRRPETGWGEALQPMLDASAARVVNRARNGRSTRTFLEEGLWQGILDDLRPGDYVMIQFGHNDGASDRPDRYTPPEDYRANLARFVDEARERGAIPVLLTPVMRRRFDADGTFRDAHGVYPDLVRAVAAEKAVPLIDMHRKSEQRLVALGPDASRRLFLQLAPGENPNYPDGIEDNTHFSPLGARLMAEAVVEGIRELGIGLAEHLRPAEPAR
jgi:lysophospholipase L1-like esterase